MNTTVHRVRKQVVQILFMISQHSYTEQEVVELRILFYNVNVGYNIARSAIAVHCDYHVARHPLEDIATY